MKEINLARVLLGGLLAGIVIAIGESVFNGVLFAPDVEAAMARLNLPPVGGGAIGIFVTISFALGISAVWLYAAIRSRFGPGVGTAIRAGIVVWLLAYLLPLTGRAAMGVLALCFVADGVAWGLGGVVM